MAFFFSFRMVHRKLLLYVLQSPCTWSNHQDSYPRMTLQLHLINKEKETAFISFCSHVFGAQLYLNVVHVQMDRCVCMLVHQRARDYDWFKTKFPGCRRLKMTRWKKKEWWVSNWNFEALPELRCFPLFSLWNSIYLLASKSFEVPADSFF